MSTVYPTGTGNWTAVTWNDDATGAAYGPGSPQVGDTVLTNNKTVTINTSIHVASLKTIAGTTASAGGGFTCSTAGTTITVDTTITAGTSHCLTISNSSGTITVTGSGLTINGSATNGNIGLMMSGAGTVAITGNAVGGGAVSAYGIYHNSGGTINLTGNVTGGSANVTNGAFNSSSGTFTISGISTGGSVQGASGAVNFSTGTMTVGTATGGGANGCYGIDNQGAGVVNVTTVNGSTTTSVRTGFGVYNGSTGQVLVSGVATAGNSPAIGDNFNALGFIKITSTGSLVSNVTGGIAAINATHWCMDSAASFTVSKGDTPPTYSGNVTLRSSGLVAPVHMNGGMV